MRQTRKEKSYNTLLLLADTRAGKKDVFQVRCLSEANFWGSKGGLDKQLRTRGKFQLAVITPEAGTTSQNNKTSMTLRCYQPKPSMSKNTQGSGLPDSPSLQEQTSSGLDKDKERTLLCYLRDKRLAGIDTQSIAPTEKSRPRGKVQGISGVPEVNSSDSHNLLRKACLQWRRSWKTSMREAFRSLGLDRTSAYGAAPVDPTAAEARSVRQPTRTTKQDEVEGCLSSSKAARKPQILQLFKGASDSRSGTARRPLQKTSPVRTVPSEDSHPSNQIQSPS